MKKNEFKSDFSNFFLRLDLVVVGELTFPLGPTGGSNLGSGLPTISLRTRNYKLFTASPFSVFIPIAFLYASNITFQVKFHYTFRFLIVFNTFATYSLFIYPVSPLCAFIP